MSNTGGAVGALIVAHGSRNAGVVASVEDIVRQLRTRFGDMPIVVGYIEFSDDTVEHGLRELIARGVTDIRVVPCLLFEGKHVGEWLPREVERVCGGYPNVRATIAPVLGGDSRIVDILAERITPD